MPKIIYTTTCLILLLGIVSAPCLALSGFSSAGTSAAQRLFREANQKIVLADRTLERGDAEAALRLYRQAAATYTDLEGNYPDSQIDPALVRFRLSYCDGMIVQLSGATPQPVAPEEAFPPPSGATPQPVAPEEAFPPPSGALSAAPGQAESGLDPEKEAAGASLSGAELSEQLQALRSRGQHEEALQLLRQTLNQNPHSTPVRLLLAWVFIANSDYDDALLTLRDLPSVDRDDEPALLLKAAAQYGEGLPFDALLSLDQALQRNPRSPQAYLNLAWLRHRMDTKANVREAEAFYRFAIRLGAHRDLQLESLLGMGDD